MMKKIIWGIVILLVLILIGAGIYIYNLYNTFDEGVTSSYEPTDRERSELRQDDASVDDSFTVLILGTDENEARVEKNGLSSDDFRTDSMILATFDKNEDDVKLVNIPRDTMAFMNSEGYFDKINHAYSLGGASSSMDAVESLLNVPVDYYIRLNMGGVVDIVDSVGGIEFDVPFDMNEPNQHDQGRVLLEQGVQELDGEEALAVVRSRRVDSDLGRGNRQMELIEAVLNKVKSSGGLNKIDDLIEVVANNTRHNFTTKDIRNLATYYAFNDISFDSTQLRGTDFWSPNTGGYYYRADDEHLYILSNTIRSILEIEPSEPFDLINIRLSDYLVPLEFFNDYIMDEFVPEYIPYYAESNYESSYGDGFATDEFNYEESDIEGEDDLENTIENPDGSSEGNTNEEEVYDDGTGYDNGTGYDDGTQYDDFYEDSNNYYDDGTTNEEEYYDDSSQSTDGNYYY